jgi:hypothetical protein
MWLFSAGRGSPLSANLRSLGLYTEDLSRRDSVKVARYEVLGNDAKRQVRPGRSNRLAFGLACRSAIACIARSSLPLPGRIALLTTLTQSAAADTGLLS